MTVLFAVLGAYYGSMRAGSAASQGGSKPPAIQLEAKEYPRTSPLEIKADGTVVDGHGATFRGSGSGVGIHIGSFKNVTVKNLKLVGFAVGLHAEGASGLSVLGVSVNAAAGAPKAKGNIGFKLDRVSDSALTGDQVGGEDAGAMLTGCMKVTVEKSDFSHNGSSGLKLSGSSSCIVRDNKLSFQEGGDNPTGLAIENGSSHNQILRNIAVHCKTNGMTLGVGDGAPCTDNLLQGNDGSWTEGGNGFAIKGQAKNNVNSNVAAFCQVGILLSGVSDTTVKGNLLVGNSQYGIEDDGGSSNVYDSDMFAKDTGSAVAFYAKNAPGKASLRLFQNVFVGYQKPLLIENASPITLQSNTFSGTDSLNISDLASVTGQAPLAFDNQSDGPKGGPFIASVGSLAATPSIFDRIGGVSVSAMVQKDAEVVVEGSLTGAFQGEEEVLTRFKGELPVDLTFPPRTMMQLRIKGVRQVPAAFLALLGDHSLANRKEATDDFDTISVPNFAIDGDWSSPDHGWQPKKGKAGEWWQVDLKETAMLTCFSVMSDPSKPDGFWGKFHIEVSPTGQFRGEQTTVITDTNWSARPGALHFYKCAPVEARYVRLVGDQDQVNVRLAQFGVYGQEH